MMKKVLLSLIVFFTLTICFASTVTGRWAGTIAGQFEVTVNIKEDAGKLSGIVSSQIGEIPLTDGSINGNDITFKELSYNGIAISYIKGKVDGDKINVTVGFQGQDLQGTLTRIK
jgi:hypothetical protein